MKNIILDFFGEQISIPISKDLSSIRLNISEKFLMTISDANEIILYYQKENKNIFIENENDYKIFLKENINKIFLDISQNSQIYKKNYEELTKEVMNNKLEKLYKKRDELNNIYNTKFKKEEKEILQIKKEIKKLKIK